MVINLRTKHCVPCEGGTQPMKKEEIGKYLETLSDSASDADPAWGPLEEDTKIQKTYTFLNFSEALAFVNSVGDIAESEGHHPDIFLHDYKHVTITLSTHSIGGLSENDFILATKIDQDARNRDHTIT